MFTAWLSAILYLFFIKLLTLMNHFQMNVMALGFLQHEPAENWFDYFVDINRFYALLQDENTGLLLLKVNNSFFFRQGVYRAAL
jgi:hypothetical protein